jgi:hypothetical protein
MDKFGAAREPIKLKGGPITHLELEEAVVRAVKALYVDPGRDWVGQVVRERMLADLHTRILREAPGAVRARTYL